MSDLSTERQKVCIEKNYLKDFSRQKCVQNFQRFNAKMRKKFSNIYAKMRGKFSKILRQNAYKILKESCILCKWLNVSKFSVMLLKTHYMKVPNEKCGTPCNFSIKFTPCTFRPTITVTYSWKKFQKLSESDGGI